MDFAGEPVFVLLSQHAQQIGVFWRFGPYCHYYCTVTGDGWMPLLAQALLSAYHPPNVYSQSKIFERGAGKRILTTDFISSRARTLFSLCLSGCNVE